MNWYALHVRPNHERLVADRLDAASIEAFYPHVMAPAPRSSQHRNREIERKFMPGYVFGRFALERKTPVIAIPWVVNILGWGSHAVPIPESEIEAVRKIVRLPSVQPHRFLNAGDRIRVRCGPLVGFEGYVVRRKNVAWVVVSVTMSWMSSKGMVPQDVRK